jgi:hypothetical protein
MLPQLWGFLTCNFFCCINEKMATGTKKKNNSTVCKLGDSAVSQSALPISTKILK